MLEFIAYQVEQGLAMSTIRGRLAAIAHAFRIQAKRSPTSSDIVVRATRNAARRVLEHRRQAAPLRLAEMRSIVTALPIVAPNRPTMRRDQLLVALGWASALRPRELVGLDVDDLTVVGDPNTGDGGVIDPGPQRQRRPTGVDWVAVPYATQLHTCPVRMAIAYTAAIRTGPMFRHIDRHGRTRRRLGARAVSDVVRRAVTDDPADRPRRLQLALPPGRVRHRSPRPRRPRRPHRPPHPPHPPRPTPRRHPQRLRPTHRPPRNDRRSTRPGGGEARSAASPLRFVADGATQQARSAHLRPV